MSLRAYARIWPVALLLFGAQPARAEFNPQGRIKKQKPAAHPSAAQPGAQPKPARPAAGTAQATAGTAQAAPDTQGPSNAALIQRYTALVLAQPGADFPLQRLLELYRERDGRLDAGPDRAWAPAFQTWRSYLVMAFMIGLGVALRHSSAPRVVLAVIYEAIGGGLLIGAYVYLRRILQKSPA